MKENLEIMNGFKELAPLLRKEMGMNTPDPAFSSVMIYLLAKINDNLEKLNSKIDTINASKIETAPIKEDTLIIEKIPAVKKTTATK